MPSFFQDKYVDTPRIMGDLGGKGLEPDDGWCGWCLENVQQTGTKRKTEEREQLAQPILRRNDAADVRIDVRGGIDAAPDEETHCTHDIEALDFHVVLSKSTFARTSLGERR